MTGYQKVLEALGILYNTDHDNLTLFYLNVGKCISGYISSAVKRILKYEKSAFIHFCSWNKH